MKCLEHSYNNFRGIFHSIVSFYIAISLCYLIILVYSFYCQFFEPVTKTLLLFVDIKLHKTAKIHIQNIYPCVKADESCQPI